MNKNNAIFVFVFVVSVATLLIYSPKNNQSKSERLAAKTNETGEIVTVNEDVLPVNITATFEIYTKGTKRIFTSSMYHNLSEDVYIESTDPFTIHVKRSGVTWADFFGTLPMELTKDCLTTGTGQTFCSNEGGSLIFELNGIKSPNALDLIINDGDKLVVLYE